MPKGAQKLAETQYAAIRDVQNFAQIYAKALARSMPPERRKRIENETTSPRRLPAVTSRFFFPIERGVPPARADVRSSHIVL
jgi:hypothetical protein